MRIPTLSFFPPLEKVGLLGINLFEQFFHFRFGKNDYYLSSERYHFLFEEYEFHLCSERSISFFENFKNFPN